MTTGKGADEIAKARLGSAENAVFWALIGRLRPSGQNLVRASWGSLAQRTDYARANVGKALRKLERRGFIKKLPLKGRETAVYMVNPYLVFSGGADSRKSALAMWNRDALSKADLALAEDLPPLEEDVLEGEVTSARTGQEIVSR